MNIRKFIDMYRKTNHNNANSSKAQDRLNQKTRKLGRRITKAVEKKDVFAIKDILERHGELVMECEPIRNLLLSHSVDEGWLNILEQLIRNGCEISPTFHDEVSPLHIAIRNLIWMDGDTECVVDYLIERGIDVDATTHLECRTALDLIFPYYYQHEATIKLLLKAGASIKTVHISPDNLTALKEYKITRELKLYDLFTTDDYRYLVNKTISESIDSSIQNLTDILKSPFPRELCRLIRCKFDLDEERFSLLNQAKESFDVLLRMRSISNKIPLQILPDHLNEEIVFRLNLNDTMNLIRCGESLKILLMEINSKTE